MAHSTPKAVENHGHAKRLSTAVGAFVVELTLDRRVLAYYDQWRAARTQTDREFEHLLAEYPETIETFIADIHAQDHAATARFLGPLLHRLPAAWTDMLTTQLLCAFRTVRYRDRAAGAGPPMFGVAVQLQPTHPRGKVPQNPYPVAHNMRWLYRRYVPERRATLRALAGEHAAYTQRDPDDCLRDVKRCLKQAWGFLDLAARSDWAAPAHIVVPEK